MVMWHNIPQSFAIGSNEWNYHEQPSRDPCYLRRSQPRDLVHCYHPYYLRPSMLSLAFARSRLTGSVKIVSRFPEIFWACTATSVG